MENKNVENKRITRNLVVNRKENTLQVLVQEYAKSYRKMTVAQISENYQRIGEEAFRGSMALEKVVLPRSLVELGDRVFQGCSNLKEVELPSSLTRIGEGCFANCTRLERARIPAYVESIASETFLWNRNLREVLFSRRSRLVSVGIKAFDKCDSLEHILLPDTVREIGYRAFNNCRKLSEIHFPQNLLYIGDAAFYFCDMKNIILPEGLCYIGRRAFCNLRYLDIAILPASVRYIGDKAFRGCNRMRILEIHGNPQYIGESIANHCVTVRCVEGSRVDEYCRKEGYTVEYLEEEIDADMGEELEELE